MLTQFARLSEQLKLPYTKARVSQTTHFIRGGTVIENDIYGEPGELVTNIDVDSDEPADKVARIDDAQHARVRQRHAEGRGAGVLEGPRPMRSCHVRGATIRFALLLRATGRR
jgi:hypothetical protein